jgi:hypothetical protein
MLRAMINSHTLLQFSLIFAAVIGMSSTVLAADSGKPQYYELRVYSTRSEEQQKLVIDYWKNAAVPAYNRMRIRPIGVFTEVQDSPTNHIYVLIPYDSLQKLASVPAKLADDARYQAASSNFMARPTNSPPYERIESSLNVAFESMKRLAVPPPIGDRSQWVFELRTYQSMNESKGIKKVEMFNSGESALMREVGLCPVFFAQALIGSQTPNLVYMVSGTNMDEHKKHWQTFRDAPLWKALSTDPQYKDTVSHISSIFLKRTDASQL